MAVNRPVLGLYVRSPSLSKPRFPPSTSPPAVNTTALSSLVFSLSVIVTVVATVATAAVPEYPLDVIVPNDAAPSLNVIVPPSALISMFAPTSKVKSPASDMVLPFIVTSSTVNVVSVPSDVMFPCAAVCKVPASCVAVNLPVLGL